jgi:hypothetical protein
MAEKKAPKKKLKRSSYAVQVFVNQARAFFTANPEKQWLWERDLIAIRAGTDPDMVVVGTFKHLVTEGITKSDSLTPTLQCARVDK